MLSKSLLIRNIKNESERKNLNFLLISSPILWQGGDKTYEHIRRNRDIAQIGSDFIKEHSEANCGSNGHQAKYSL